MDTTLKIITQFCYLKQSYQLCSQQINAATEIITATKLLLTKSGKFSVCIIFEKHKSNKHNVGKTNFETAFKHSRCINRLIYNLSKTDKYVQLKLIYKIYLLVKITPAIQEATPKIRKASKYCSPRYLAIFRHAKNDSTA